MSLAQSQNSGEGVLETMLYTVRLFRAYSTDAFN